MYFLWKDTPCGIIRVSCDGLCEFVNEAMKPKLRLYSVTLSPSGIKEEADMSIVLSEENIIPETKKVVESHFASVLSPMGINASVVWASPERSLGALVGSGWAWAGFAAAVAVLVTAGAEGFFWTAFWAMVAWFAVYGFKILARHFRRTAHHGS